MPDYTARYGFYESPVSKGKTFIRNETISFIEVNDEAAKIKAENHRDILDESNPAYSVKLEGLVETRRII